MSFSKARLILVLKKIRSFVFMANAQETISVVPNVSAQTQMSRKNEEGMIFEQPKPMIEAIRATVTQGKSVLVNHCFTGTFNSCFIQIARPKLPRTIVRMNATPTLLGE